MEKYKNLSGKSNVSQYEIGLDYIDVKFSDRNNDGCDTYKYSYSSTGKWSVDHMKQLAIAGIGLNTFINTEVKKGYASKW